MASDMLKALLGLEHHRIRFTTGEGDYEGTIFRIVPEIELLIIQRLVWLPKNTTFNSLTFRAKHIKAFEVLGRSESPKPRIVTNHDPRKYYGNTEIHTLLDEQYDETFSENESELYAEMYPEEKEFAIKLPPALADYLPLDNVIIEELDDNFSDAIRHMKKQDLIGVSLESPKINRYEELHWLCISTESCTFLFDIHLLGKMAFTKGLKDILEDSKIEKVLHDCRQVSDCLFHQFDTKLVNVFDTQVADFIVNQQRIRTGKITARVNQLNSCLAQYLEVPDEFLYYRKPRSYQDELVFYGLRPISDNLRDFFIKNVIYLIKLRQELDPLLIEPLSRCVQIYLHTLQKKTNRELELETFNPSKLPGELLTDEIQVFRFKDHVEVPAVVASGPPYHKIKNSIQNFLTYCENHKIGEINTNFIHEKRQNALGQLGKVNNSKSQYKGTCVNFADGKVAICDHPRKLNNSCDSDSSTKSDGSDSAGFQNVTSTQETSNCNNINSAINEWARFRKAFEDTGPTEDGRKLRFVPA